MQGSFERSRQTFASRKELKMKGHWSFDYVVEDNSGVTVVRWFDNGLV